MGLHAITVFSGMGLLPRMGILPLPTLPPVCFPQNKLLVSDHISKLSWIEVNFTLFTCPVHLYVITCTLIFIHLQRNNGHLCFHACAVSEHEQWRKTACSQQLARVATYINIPLCGVWKGEHLNLCQWYSSYSSVRNECNKGMHGRVQTSAICFR